MQTSQALAAKTSASSLLVVSQDLGIRRTVRAWMELEELGVSEVSSARGPLGAEPDLVVLDAAGESHLEEILAQRTALFPGAPVIVIGVDHGNEATERFLRAGAYDVVPRPLDRARLSLVVSRALELRRLNLRLEEVEGALVSHGGANSLSPAGGEVIPLAELERRAIRHALLVTRGNVSEAARLLGVGRSTLYRHLSPEQVAEARPASVRVGAVAAFR